MKQTNYKPAAKLFFTLGKSTLFGYLVTTLLLLILAFFFYRFGISEKGVSISILCVYILSSFATGFLCGKSMKNRKFLWGFLSGLLYFIIFSLLSLFFQGSEGSAFANGITLFLVCIGSSTIGGMLA